VDGRTRPFADEYALTSMAPLAVAMDVHKDAISAAIAPHVQREDGRLAGERLTCDRRRERHDLTGSLPAAASSGEGRCETLAPPVARVLGAPHPRTSRNGNSTASRLSRSSRRWPTAVNVEFQGWKEMHPRLTRYTRLARSAATTDLATDASLGIRRTLIHAGSPGRAWRH
jgi:hypothetical protein